MNRTAKQYDTFTLFSNMTYAQFRGHLFDIHVAFTRYHKGFYYMWMRYVIAPRIQKRKTPIESGETHPNLSMHILCRHGSVTRFLWAMASFYSVSKTVGSLTIHNDGTLREDELALIKRLLPSARVVRKEDFIDAATKAFAPYPQVLAFFNTPMWQARKLLHPYLSATRPYMLQLESDVLWFRDPEFINDALRSGFSKTYAMPNNDESTISFQDGTVLPPHLAELNSGFMLYKKDDLNLSRLEEYLTRTGIIKHHFIEQAGYAYAFGDFQKLPEDLYTIKGTNEKDAIMRHYTGPVRGKYFIRGIPFLIKNHIVRVRD